MQEAPNHAFNAVRAEWEMALQIPEEAWFSALSLLGTVSTVWSDSHGHGATQSVLGLPPLQAAAVVVRTLGFHGLSNMRSSCQIATSATSTSAVCSHSCKVTRPPTAG